MTKTRFAAIQILYAGPSGAGGSGSLSCSLCSLSGGCSSDFSFLAGCIFDFIYTLTNYEWLYESARLGHSALASTVALLTLVNLDVVACSRITGSSNDSRV